jgi:hypothetical protein
MDLTSEASTTYDDATLGGGKRRRSSSPQEELSRNSKGVFCRFISFKHHYRMSAYKYGGLLEPYKFGLVQPARGISYLK